ncbi:BCCT family transporter [Corynebacterium sp. P5848]|uniref:BCCT family transporter n=1 Tax=Corynebacterium marambiense TaxID=2765364 RepID=UPI002260D339|nr:BCCT family transporter [Corynebacterium marambiense]MCX7543240.1 BCCT family transporter [Corynebacterium marambiense]
MKSPGQSGPAQTTPPEQSTEESPENNVFFGWLKTDPLIFFLSGGIIVAFVAAAVIFGEDARRALEGIATWLLTDLGWLYIGGVSICVVFLLGVFVSHFGRMRLGDDDDEPEHSVLAWFAMLFAGGIGAVLMFWGVAEPLHHMTNPPMADVEPGSQEAAVEAMAFTFYHFGAHMWVIMALPGLALGYFIYKRKLPPRLSSVFAPVLGARIYSWPGKLIDVLAIVGTVFGIAVSVGLGTLQINAGMNMLWGVPVVGLVELGIIVFITLIASISVASGLERGIKVLSNVNIAMAVVLMVFVLITGPTLTLLRSTVQGFGIYVDNAPGMMFYTDAFGNNPGWQGSWTVFYWAWTICWSPFVGMFVARISKGRTVREFIAGVICLPAIFSVIWFAIFGRAGFEVEALDPGVLVGPVVEEGNTAAALFTFLDYYPATGVVSIFALAIVVIFFITSIDSSAMVTDMFATGEEDSSPVYYRIMWACAIGAVAAALLIMSPDTGIETLQQVVIIVALPFFIMQFVMMYSLMKGMIDDAAAKPKMLTRQWDQTDSPEKLAEQENRPAPGYDADGNPLPPLAYEYDEDGNIVISGNVVVDGDLDVKGGENKESDEKETVKDS